MPGTSLEQLLAAGVHFGHQTRRWNPKMRRFIFAERNGIHIIDLQKTLRQIELAQKLVREVVLKGDSVLFVCTKRQLAAIVKAEAERSGSMFVTERWLGGMLTNFQTVKKQVRKLKELEAGAEDGTLRQLHEERTAPHVASAREAGQVFVRYQVDDAPPRPAVHHRFQEGTHRRFSEANKLGVPIVAIVDTNADPDLITVPIAGNDDAIRSVELIAKVIGDTIAEARREAPARAVEEEQESFVYSTDRGSESAGRGDRGGRGGSGGGSGGGAPAADAGAGAGGDEERRRRRPRRRRAKPEAIAARLKTGGEAAVAMRRAGEG